MASEHKKEESAIDLFGKSYRLVLDNLNIYALVYAVPAILAIATTIKVISDNGDGWSLSNSLGSSFGPNYDSGSAFSSAGMLAVVLIGLASIIFYLLATILNLHVAQGKKPEFSELWSKFAGNFLWLRLIGLSIASALLVLGGLILLIVPGIIIIWRLFLAPYIMIDQNTSIGDAITKSWKMTTGHGWAIYSIIIFSFVLSLVGVIPVAGTIASFLLTTGYAVAPALRYQELKHHNH